jgi:hypothetical protein
MFVASLIRQVALNELMETRADGAVSNSSVNLSMIKLKKFLDLFCQSQMSCAWHIDGDRPGIVLMIGLTKLPQVKPCQDQPFEQHD